jgi:hypothetical protein
LLQSELYSLRWPSSAGIAQLVEQLICNLKMDFCRLWQSLAAPHYTRENSISVFAVICSDMLVFVAAV